ncbi:MAG: hypothetical protein EOO63_16415, partial [Hymenobacter sp.]
MKHLLLNALQPLGLLLLSAGIALAQPTVTALMPARNGMVTRNGSVSVTFSNVLDASSTAALRVFSAQQGGKKAGQAVVVGNQLTFTPTKSFLPGENLWVTLTTAARDQNNITLAQPQVWQLSGAVTSSPGTFSRTATIALPGIADLLATGDLDGDGDLDIVSANTTGVLSVQSNDGTGTFAARADMVMTYTPRALNLGDVDGDGDLDVVVTGSSTQLSYCTVFTNDGQATFTAQATLGVGLASTTVGLADLDGDSDLDLVLSEENYRAVTMYPNNGTGTFGTGSAVKSLATFGTSVIAGDIDNDGDLDLLAFNTSTNQVNIRLNT